MFLVLTEPLDVEGREQTLEAIASAGAPLCAAWLVLLGEWPNLVSIHIPAVKELG